MGRGYRGLPGSLTSRGFTGSDGDGAGLLGDSAPIQAGASAADVASAADAASAGTIDAVAGGGVGAVGDTSGLPGLGEAASGANLAGDASGLPGVASGAVDAAGANQSLFLGAAESKAVPAPDVAPTTGNPDLSAIGPNGITPEQTAALPNLSNAPPPPVNPGNVGATDSAGNLITRGTGIGANGQLTDINPGSGSGLGGFASKLVDYAGEHPVVALGALQAGGSLLTGAFSTLTPAQVNLYNAQAAANDAAAAFTKSQTANLQMPKAVASSAPVTGTAPLVPIAARPTAAPAAAPAPGFINQAPVPSAPVTGTAA